MFRLFHTLIIKRTVGESEECRKCQWANCSWIQETLTPHIHPKSSDIRTMNSFSYKSNISSISLVDMRFNHSHLNPNNLPKTWVTHITTWSTLESTPALPPNLIMTLIPYVGESRERRKFQWTKCSWIQKTSTSYIHLKLKTLKIWIIYFINAKFLSFLID